MDRRCGSIGNVVFNLVLGGRLRRNFILGQALPCSWCSSGGPAPWYAPLLRTEPLLACLASQIRALIHEAQMGLPTASRATNGPP
jgi:hypothetical protein